jgi:hypothetical protein
MEFDRYSWGFVDSAQLLDGSEFCKENTKKGFVLTFITVADIFWRAMLVETSIPKAADGRLINIKVSAIFLLYS